MKWISSRNYPETQTILKLRPAFKFCHYGFDKCLFSSVNESATINFNFFLDFTKFNQNTRQIRKIRINKVFANHHSTAFTDCYCIVISWRKREDCLLLSRISLQTLHTCTCTKQPNSDSNLALHTKYNTNLSLQDSPTMKKDSAVCDLPKTAIVHPWECHTPSQ